MSEHPAVINLRNNQRQLDWDGIFVEVSRQAVEETLEEIERLTARVAELEAALDKACEPIETKPKVGSSIDYANGFVRGAQSQRVRAWTAREGATQRGAKDE